MPVASSCHALGWRCATRNWPNTRSPFPLLTNRTKHEQYGFLQPFFLSKASRIQPRAQYPHPSRHLPAHLGDEIPPDRGRRRPRGPRAGRHLGTGGSRGGSGRAQAGTRALGPGLPRGDGRFRLPAGGAHPGRCRRGARGDALQLLRHGPHRGRPLLDLRQREGGRAHHAAGRRHRSRLLHLAPAGCAGERASARMRPGR